jgi:hypothetical protein
VQLRLRSGGGDPANKHSAHQSKNYFFKQGHRGISVDDTVEEEYETVKEINVETIYKKNRRNERKSMVLRIKIENGEVKSKKIRQKNEEK